MFYEHEEVIDRCKSVDSLIINNSIDSNDQVAKLLKRSIIRSADNHVKGIKGNDKRKKPSPKKLPASSNTSFSIMRLFA